jgi:hypothetical protein
LYVLIAISFPDGEKSISVIEELEIVIAFSFEKFFSTFQTIIDASWLPESKYLPSFEKATTLTLPLCPTNVNKFVWEKLTENARLKIRTVILFLIII